jgi:hypothetical protein
LYLTFRVNPCNEVVKKISVDQGRRIKIVLWNEYFKEPRSSPYS